VHLTSHSFLRQIGRWFNPRTRDAGIGHYKKVTSSFKGIHGVERMLEDLVLARKKQASENEKLRSAYLSPRWAQTNAGSKAFVVGLFAEALEAEEGKREAWPRGNRFEAGFTKHEDQREAPGRPRRLVHEADEGAGDVAPLRGGCLLLLLLFLKAGLLGVGFAGLVGGS